MQYHIKLTSYSLSLPTCKVEFSDAQKQFWFFGSLQCFDTVGWGQEGHPACKKFGVGLLVETI